MCDTRTHELTVCKKNSYCRNRVYVVVRTGCKTGIRLFLFHRDKAIDSSEDRVSTEHKQIQRNGLGEKFTSLVVR